MQSRYKLIVSNKNIYKEIDLSPDMEELRLGTTMECDVRLRKELFFGHVILSFVRNQDIWNVFCSDNLYLTLGDVRKLITRQLQHGDELLVKYQNTDNELFRLSFMIDFEYEEKDYNRVIDLAGKQEVTIGGTPNSDIYISDAYLGTDSMTLKREQNGWLLVDNGSKYGTHVNGARINGQKSVQDYDFFSIVGYSFYYKQNRLYTSSRQEMAIRRLTSGIAEQHSTHFSYPKFNRNTRVQYVLPMDELEIQQAKPMPGKPKKNIVMTLIPTVVMLAMTIVLRGIIGGGGTFVIYSAVSMSIGVIMSVITYIQDKKQYKKDYEERLQVYNEYIVKKRKEIEQARAEELRVRNLIYESLENSLTEVKEFGRRLFEKSAEDKDFLQIYLGKGRIESANQVSFNKQEFLDLEDPLAPVPEEVAEFYRYIDDAPIISDFHASCGVGVVGARGELEQVLKNLTLDVAIRHFYGDVRLVYILDEEFAQKMEWVRWLHNVENAALGVRNIICDDESRNLLLENLYSILSVREAKKEEEEESRKQTVPDVEYVVFVTDTSAISRHPVSKYIKNSKEYGFTFVFLEEYEEELPQGCTEIIRIDNTSSGHALKTENGDVIADFHYPSVPDTVALEAALKLGAVTVDEVTLEGQLTKNITMFELLGIMSVDDLNLEERWRNSLAYKSLAAPLGVKKKNEVVYLDISDKAGAHGPHGLVAGTTGSGKSEILQTYILSIATLFHPYEVGFVIIDFKGGGMANQFKDLPHLIGTITNIDGREINRSLLSIKAELVKRQEMFAAAGVNHINDYIKLFKAEKVTVAMPHLIMIVDEFAELKSEHPDFMKELISAARIGRTLGVHLILATQKPAGVVDAQIWSNSKFKLCLKVQTKEDSKEVLKTPLAAEIIEPGRAYFQVGNNEIFDLFQSAYSGANVPSGDDVNENIYEIYEKNIWGKRTLVYTNKKKSKKTSQITQLDAIVEYVGNYCISQGIRQLPGICLPSMEEHIPTRQLNYESSQDEVVVSTPIGLFDDPEQQYQGEMILEVSRDNVYIVGSAQTGKTVMLQTILYGLIQKYDPSQVNAYLIDCGSMVLKTFEDSFHVGGVVLSNEDEKCKNLFKLLNTLIIDRKKVLSGKGVGNYAAYLDAGFTDMPMVVVMIDNMAAFKEYFPDQADEINSISREAAGVGISLIITAATANTLNYRTQANFGKKFVLNCNDPNDYSNVLGHCKISPKENPGRGLFLVDKRILEFQIAMFGESRKEAERSQELKDYIAKRNQACKGRATAIPMIPEKLVLSEVMQENNGLFRNKGILPIGMEFATVDYSLLNLSTSGFLALIGDPDSRDRFVKNMLLMLAKTIVFHNVEAIIIDDKQRKLKECSEYGFIRNYTADVTEGMQLVSDFYDELNRRQREMEDMSEYDSYLLLIIQNAEVFRKICSDKNESKALADAMKTAGEAGAFVMMTAVENQAVGFNSPEVYKVIKDLRKAVLFAPLNENKIFEISFRAKPDPSFDKSMGYRFDGSNVSKIKIYE